MVERGSIDGTRESLDAQRARIAVVLTSGDATICDALNQGIAQAQGEWVLLAVILPKESTTAVALVIGVAAAGAIAGLLHAVDGQPVAKRLARYFSPRSARS